MDKQNMLEKTAFYQNRNDEQPNIDTARELFETRNTAGIQEIADGLSHPNTQVCNDCIKILYEVGYLDPSLISPYAPLFLEKLHTKNNRMIWGCCTALSLITDTNADLLFSNLDVVKKCMKTEASLRQIRV